jgi:hypothetical protein
MNGRGVLLLPLTLGATGMAMAPGIAMRQSLPLRADEVIR